MKRTNVVSGLRRALALSACLFTAAIAASGCGGTAGAPATQVVVEVHTNYGVPAEMDSLLFRVETGATRLFEQTYKLGKGPGEISMPARTALVPTGDGNAVFTITATGLKEGAMLVTRRATLSFDRGRSAFLRIDLLRECLGLVCAPGSTCVTGRECKPEMITVTALPEFKPEQAPGKAPPDNPVVIPVPTESDAAVPDTNTADATAGRDLMVDLAPGMDRPLATTDAVVLTTDSADGASVDRPIVDMIADRSGDSADGARGPMPDAPMAIIDAPAPIDAPTGTTDATMIPDGGKRGNGGACTSTNDCLSGFCTDGVCCATSCEGKCVSCKIPMREGMCWPVPGGEDPRGDCPDDGKASCQRDGLCDGLGACRQYGSGTQCTPGTCVGATRTSAGTCDGMGKCKPGTTSSCGDYVCNSATGDCHSSCVPPPSATNAECITGKMCDAQGSCGKKESGQPCGMAGECKTGFCEQGVCCATACSGMTCFSCAQNTVGAGTCAPIPDGFDPKSECAAQPQNSCGTDGVCNGAGACRMWSGTTCGAAMCSGSSLIPLGSCDGTGTCTPGTAMSCGTYTCSNGACRTNCSADADCAAGYICQLGGANGGICVPPPENCTNNIDDDGDMMVDCADSDCGAFACVAGPPDNTWTGPVAIFEGTAAGTTGLPIPPACSGEFPTMGAEGNRSPYCPAATCSRCSCGSPTGASCQLPATFGDVCSPILQAPLPGPGTGSYAAKTCSPLPGTHVTTGSPSVDPSQPGSCAPTGGQVTKVAAQWTKNMRTCQRPTSGGGCGPMGSRCMPIARPPFEAKLCIYKAGDQTCPAVFTAKRVFYTGALTDNRGCSACGCDPATGVSCGGTMDFFEKCGVPAASSYKTPMDCTKTDLPAYQYTQVTSGGTCTAKAAMPSSANEPTVPAATGSCSTTGPITVCCLP